MDKDTYQSMYSHIVMKDEQKQEILEDLMLDAQTGKRQKRYDFPKIAAAILCILVLSGTTAFVAKYFNLGERVTGALQQYTRKNIDYTEKQKKLLEDCSIELDQTIPFENYSLHLDAAMFDQSEMFIPFTITDIKKNDTFLEVSRICFHINGKRENSGGCGSMVPGMEDGDTTIHGAFTLNSNVVLKKGVTIQLMEGEPYGEETGKKLGEFQLTKDSPIKEHEIDLSKVKNNSDMVIRKMSVSPLALFVEGSYKHAPLYDSDIRIVLKDGTNVKFGSFGGGGTEEEDGGVTTFEFKIAFETPIDRSQIKEIVVKSRFEDFDFTIPYKEK